MIPTKCQLQILVRAILSDIIKYNETRLERAIYKNEASITRFIPGGIYKLEMNLNFLIQ